MRRMNLPPVRRAQSQLNKAVRAPPTCKYPVGDGANRVTTFCDTAWHSSSAKPVKTIRLSHSKTVVKHDKTGFSGVRRRAKRMRRSVDAVDSVDIVDGMDLFR